MRTITVPAGGATLSFWVTRDTEPTWDFMFVEAHTVGADDWTTLPDAQRPHELRRRQLVPARELAEDPPVPHALPDRQRRRHVHADGHDRRVVGGDRRRATATSSGRSTSRAYAGKQVEVSITYASDDVVQPTACSSTTSSSRPGEGDDLVRGRRRHARRLDGARRARGQPGQHERLDRRHRRRRCRANFGDGRRGSFAREPEIIAFLVEQLRPVSVLGDVGGIVDHLRGRRLRAREPDPPDLRAGVLLRPGRRRQRRRPRARPPVVRRQRLRRTSGRTSGSTRASRPTPSGCGASTRDSARRRRSSTEPREHPGGRPVLAARRSATRGRTTCSTRPSTCAAR